MNNKTIVYGFAVLCLLLTNVACSDWLDVKPKTAVEDDDLFSREQGFKENLTGIYMLLSDTTMYGRELSYGITDILAQRYEPGGGSDKELQFTEPEWYTFPSKKTEYYCNSLWGKMYNAIANINNFLMWIEKNRSVLTTPGYYEIMKGEAFGIRAFLYLDLLRLYGPIYNQNPDDKALPWRTEFSREEKAFSTANQILDYIEQDLERADSLLQNDPMNIEFPKSSSDQTLNLDDFLRYRLKRMNRYAVKAVAARMYMWKGDKINAAKMAREVIEAKNEEGTKYFELVTDNSTDRLFSTEIIFGVSLYKFEDQVKKDFQISPFETNFYLQDKNRLSEIFDIEVDGANDMRYRDGQGFSFSGKSCYSIKYEQGKAYSFVVDNLIPLIRLPEMYYILAECTDDLATSANILSQVRAARGIDDVNPFSNEKEKEYNIMKEYRKEFYAEGQLWYYYKRHAYKTFLHCPMTIDLTEANYRFSIPDNEKEFGKVD